MWVFLTLAIFSKFFGELDLGALKNLKLNEWWKLMGGMLGAFMVFSSIFVAPKLGLVLMFLFVIFGQISASLILDYIGAFGLERKEISLSKIIGLIFVGVGVLIYLSKDLRQIF